MWQTQGGTESWLFLYLHSSIYPEILILNEFKNCLLFPLPSPTFKILPSETHVSRLILTKLLGIPASLSLSKKDVLSWGLVPQQTIRTNTLRRPCWKASQKTATGWQVLGGWEHWHTLGLCPEKGQTYTCPKSKEVIRLQAGQSQASFQGTCMGKSWRGPHPVTSPVAAAKQSEWIWESQLPASFL